MSLPDADGLALIRELRAGNQCPIILLAEDPTVKETVQALRLQVADLLRKPFDLTDLSSAVSDLADKELKRRRDKKRVRRLKRLASRVVSERQDLNRRMDLVCRDFVHAYRRLAQKVTESDELTHQK
ncbi:MAG: response regulator, partial [Planctomycetota bacterium]|jgi:DNA-binding NtrC family response regulator